MNLLLIQKPIIISHQISYKSTLSIKQQNPGHHGGKWLYNSFQRISKSPSCSCSCVQATQTIVVNQYASEKGTSTNIGATQTYIKGQKDAFRYQHHNSFLVPVLKHLVTKQYTVKVLIQYTMLVLTTSVKSGKPKTIVIADQQANTNKQLFHLHTKWMSGLLDKFQKPKPNTSHLFSFLSLF